MTIVADTPTIRYGLAGIIAAIGTTWIIYKSLKTGAVGMGRSGPPTERSKQPTLYWIFMAFWAVVSLVSWIGALSFINDILAR